MLSFTVIYLILKDLILTVTFVLIWRSSSLSLSNVGLFFGFAFQQPSITLYLAKVIMIKIIFDNAVLKNRWDSSEGTWNAQKNTCGCGSRKFLFYFSTLYERFRTYFEYFLWLAKICEDVRRWPKRIWRCFDINSSSFHR